MSSERSILFALVVGLAPSPALPAAAPSPGTAAEASPAAPYQARADLREEYLAGEPLVVRVELANPSGHPLAVPDVGRRPWLVRFALQPVDPRSGEPAGQREVRRTTPPAADPGGVVTLSAGGRREVWLEVPSGAALRPGSYDFAVILDDGTPEGRLLAHRAIRLAAPRPVHVDLGDSGDLTVRQGASAVWVHRAARGFDLYRLRADGRDPTRVLGDDFLLHLEHAVEPVLSATRPADASGPHVVWMEGPRTVAWLRVQGRGIRGRPGRSDAPWPRVSLAGRPATDGDGRVVVPLWVPDPKGSGGSLRALVAGGREPPGYRLLAHLDAAPRAVIAAVDDAGTPRFLVVGRDFVDRFAPSGLSAPGVPLSGRRLFAAPAGSALAWAGLGVLPERGDHPGGRAVAVALVADGALTLRWLDLSGRPIAALPPVPLPEGAELVDCLPRGYDPPGLLLRTPEGPRFVEGERRIDLDTATGVRLLRAADGRVALWEAGSAAPVRARFLTNP